MVIFTWSVTLELLFNGIPISDIVKLLLHLPGILVVSSAGNALIILLLRRLNDMIREIMDASGVELVLIGPGSVDQLPITFSSSMTAFSELPIMFSISEVTCFTASSSSAQGRNKEP
ncbi:uncharacterized protein [Euphorbia lathyris]|uniref:uncharacterized protein isoform X6 n=1 Tax=Euphorbia lathyris TaxID=212925 RepID=UPI003313F915